MNIAPVTSDSLYPQQDLIYYLSQENQTEFNNYSIGETWTYWHTCNPQVYIDIVDLDGVASGWFSYKRSNEAQWNNKSMTPSALGDNTFFGSFQVTVSEFATGFNIKFFANDSLGHISESELYGLTVHYDISTSTTTPEPVLLLPVILVIITIIGISAIVIILKLKRRT